MRGGWEYVAGLFDGEGSIGVYRQSRKTRAWGISLRISGAYLPTLEEIVDFTGYGRIHKVPRPNGGKQVWQWGIQRRSSIADFCENATPFTREKAEQLAIAYGYCMGRLEGSDTERLLKAAKVINFPAP